MLLRNKKTKKQNQPKKMEISNADMITSLPDELIHRILSFLPAKCRMSTCILSKRWYSVSTIIPTLDFRNWRTPEWDSTIKEKKQETKRFMNFLDTVLYHHEKPVIHKFYLDVGVFFDASRVSKWIRTIMSRKVEELCLYIDHSSASSLFPTSFFTCDSLTLLDLEISNFNCSKINIPNRVSFPNLKILRLSGVSFVNEASNRKFFTNCPILEELRLSNCDMSEGLYIEKPTLKHLFITYCSLSESTVEISAPGLLTISYEGRPPADFVLNSIPSLVEADLDFFFNEENGYPMPMVFVKLFEKLSSAKNLKICADTFVVLREADILSTGSLAFDNLIQLEIRTQILLSSGLDSISKVRTLFKFLQLSPNLESILFSQSIGIPDKEADGSGSLDPKCSLPQLKSIKFNFFNGDPKEINAIKLFLKYASFLETVTIVATRMLSKDEKKQLNVTKLLLKFPKPLNCVVDVLEKS